MNWFKFYGQDWLTDIKIIKMRIEDRLCFLTLLCLASANDKKGIVKDCDEETIIRLTHLYEDPYDQNNEVERARGCLERFEKLGMITRDNNDNILITNFVKRQNTNLTNYERVKRYREKQNKAKYKGKYTVINDNIGGVIKDNARIDKNRIDKNRIDKKSNVSSFKSKKPFYKLDGTPARFSEGKWWSLPKGGGEWLHIVNGEKDIEYK